MIPTYGSGNPCSTLLGTAQIPFRVDPLSACRRSDDDEVMIQKCSLNRLKFEYLVNDDLYFDAIE